MKIQRYNVNEQIYGALFVPHEEGQWMSSDSVDEKEAQAMRIIKKQKKEIDGLRELVCYSARHCEDKI